MSQENVEIARRIYDEGLIDFEWGQDLGKALEAAGGLEQAR